MQVASSRPWLLPALWVLLLVASSSAQTTERMSGTPVASDAESFDAQVQVDQQVTQIYSNGSLLGTWHDNSVGCDKCLISDPAAARNASSASYSVKMAERGVLRFTSIAAHPADSILDLWIAGSGLTSVSLLVVDSISNTASRDVRFTSSDVMLGVTVLGNDDDGFIHMHIDLAALRPTFNSSAQASKPGYSTPAAECKPVFNRFDTIEIRDVGNMGFRLVLDDVKLIAASTFSASAAPLLPMSSLVPVLADDMDDLKSGKNRYLMKLRGNVSLDQVKAVCQELAGNATTGKAKVAQRFAGVCHTPVAALKKTDRLVAFSVNSKADLKAMRKALSSLAEYFEADLTGFTTVRAMQAAIKAGNGPLSIPVDTIITMNAADYGTAAVQDRPGWTGLGGKVTKDQPDPTVKVDVIEPAKLAKGDPDYTVRVDPVGGAASEGPTATTQSVSSWGLDRLNQVNLPLDGSYSSGDFDGRGVHIYVLDTGVRTSHYDFRGRVGDGAAAVGSSVLDDNGHGTHVAGIALGGTHGVAPSAILHPVKVMGSDGSGSYSNIVSALQWVKNHRASKGITSAIVTMSLAGPRSTSLNDAIGSVSQAGITVITAAGNNKGGDSCTMSPCSAATPIVVGASTDTDALASFSNIGRCLTVFAPGNYITSSSWQSDSSEAIMSGTSMATPHVAGVAALYLQYRPQASPAEVKAAIQRAAVGRMFERNSPQLLLNAMSSRLRAAAPQTSAPAPAPAAAAPKPAPAPAAASTPAPKPAPAAQQPSSAFPSSFGMKIPSSMCATCSWCQFC